MPLMAVVPAAEMYVDANVKEMQLTTTVPPGSLGRGGPLMPLSQTLMLRIFPKDKAGAAIGIWSMTTLVAPVVGLVLLIVWVAALQLVLDEGKNLDWLASNQIITLSVVGFAAFLIWELHEKHPVVDLRVFRHRGFKASVLTVSVAYAAFFGVSVLAPLCLQSFMGYTATDAGLATAWTGVTALFVASMVANSKRDSRALVFFGARSRVPLRPRW